MEGLSCPSAQPDMEGATILGVLDYDSGTPRLAYLREAVSPTPELLALAEPAGHGRVFRFAAHCEERRCTHFDGTDCRLASRIVGMMPEVVDSLPTCRIRGECRWFQQEGRPACLRCPQVQTAFSPTDEFARSVALEA